MNYELYEDTDSINPIFITSFDEKPEFRPHVGDQITLPNDLRIFKVNRADPSDNPSDQKVKYYVNVLVPNQFSQFNIMVQDNPRI